MWLGGGGECVHAQSSLTLRPRTVTRQTSLSLAFSRQEYSSDPWLNAHCVLVSLSYGKKHYSWLGFVEKCCGTGQLEQLLPNPDSSPRYHMTCHRPAPSVPFRCPVMWLWDSSSQQQCFILTRSTHPKGIKMGKIGQRTTWHLVHQSPDTSSAPEI